jgi:hypothetical protein
VAGGAIEERKMKTMVALGGAALFALAVTGQARANILINGGLETTLPLNRFGMVYMSQRINPTALTGWTISTGTIDIVPSKYFKSSAGNFSVDLIGTPRLGGIQQTVPTSAGTAYTLTFDFSVNPYKNGRRDESDDTKVMQVDALDSDGATVLATQEFTGTVGTRTKTNMEYTQETFSFTADGPQTTLLLQALAPLNMSPLVTLLTIRCGPVIDNLDLELNGGSGGGPGTPEPASLGILGLGGLLLMRRRNRSVSRAAAIG